MFDTQPLVTEKYLQQKLKQEVRQIHRVRSRKAVQDFTTFLMGLVAIPFAILIGKQIPHWLPVVTNFLASYGIVN